MDLALITEILKYAAYIVGVFRLVVKPIMAIIETYVRGTETVKDDEVFDRVVGSSVWKGIVWFVDYLTSIKLPLTQYAASKVLGLKK